MAHFLKGKFKYFHSTGPYECVKDVIRFRQFKETSLQMELTRTDMETLAGRHLRYESHYIKLIPVEESQPRQEANDPPGGKSPQLPRAPWEELPPHCKD